MTIASSKFNTERPQGITSNTTEPTASHAEMRVLLEGISWATYEQLLAETSESRNQQLAYCDGLLEIMVPLKGHEEPTRMFDQFLAAIVDELGWEFCSLGSLTMKNSQQKKGLEPDSCFYIANEAVVRGVETLDFEVHPPPDLVIEVDNSNSSLGKLPIYEALKIPEIWRLQRGILTIYQLDSEGIGYVTMNQSRAFPQVPVQDLPQFLARAKVIGQRAAVRELVQRIRQVRSDKELS